mgnify:CR=1 FL=1
MNFFKKLFTKEKKESLDLGLKKSNESFFNKISKAVIGKSKVDDQVLDDLEEILISSDVGVKTTLKIIDKIENRVAKDKFLNSSELDLILKEEIIKIICDSENDNFLSLSKEKPHVILVVGVNGVGKTTSIGKMANYYKSIGLKVMVGAADTFRAAAIDQLQVWSDRVGVELVKQEMGSDPASVAFDTLESAINKNIDVVLIDTAGRLQNRTELMDELGKIVRVIKKQDPSAPHHCILVLDATVGQNALMQTNVFKDNAGVTGIIMTKLDGTAKGGVLVALAEKYKLPIHAIGIGEKIEDLENFSAAVFSAALSGTSELVH